MWVNIYVHHLTQPYHGRDFRQRLGENCAFLAHLSQGKWYVAAAATKELVLPFLREQTLKHGRQGWRKLAHQVSKNKIRASS